MDGKVPSHSMIDSRIVVRADDFSWLPGLRFELGGVNNARHDKHNDGKAEGCQEDVHADLEGSHAVRMAAVKPMRHHT